MSLQNLGNVGESVSAVLVLFTLAYLAVQVREAKRTVRLQALQNLNEQFNQGYMLIASNPELAGLLRRARQGEELDGAELQQYLSIVNVHFSAWENAYFHSLEGIGYSPPRLRAAVAQYFEYPGIVAIWDSTKQFRNEKFAAYIDDVIGDVRASDTGDDAE
ncbi:MAG: hypothetical protein P8Y69_13940 [Gammaproteobacteria bacterium]